MGNIAFCSFQISIMMLLSLVLAQDLMKAELIGELVTLQALLSTN
jgi:hypothetical protein